MMFDGGPKGRADPAYDAHMLPIGEWALALWEGWTTEAAMNRLIADAKERLGRARSKWAVVYGPAAAFVQTCSRLQWTVIDAATLVTDDGVFLNLRLDPPAVVLSHCFRAVQRWRW